MTKMQLAITTVLAILWAAVLFIVLIKGSIWHRNQSDLEVSHLPKGLEKAASIWMLLLAGGLCCMISLILLNFIPE